MNTKGKIFAILKCTSFAAMSLASLAVLCESSRMDADSTKEQLKRGGLILAATIATSVSSLALNDSIEEAKREFI